MDFAFRRSEYAVLPGIGEICDWSLRTHQNQLTKFLELLDSLFEDVLNPIDPWNPRAALQTSERDREPTVWPRSLPRCVRRRSVPCRTTHFRQSGSQLATRTGASRLPCSMARASGSGGFGNGGNAAIEPPSLHATSAGTINVAIWPGAVRAATTASAASRPVQARKRGRPQPFGIRPRNGLRCRK